MLPSDSHLLTLHVKLLTMSGSDLPAPENLSFASRDGSELSGVFYRTPGAKGNALIIHGYADHGGRYVEVAEKLRGVGLNVMHFDYRGHGKSVGARGYIAKFEDYLQDFEAALETLSSHGDNLPVLLVGHSNGGLIALHVLADPFRCPKAIRAAVISSPFLALKLKAPAKKLFARVASVLVPKLALPNKLASDLLTHDVDKQKEHGSDPLVHDVASARWFTETTAAQEWLEEFAPRITVPTLWLVSGMDEIADPAQSKKVRQSLVAESSYHEFPEMHHEVFNEIDREKVFTLMNEFASGQFPAQ